MSLASLGSLYMSYGGWLTWTQCAALPLRCWLSCLNGALLRLSSRELPPKAISRLIARVMVPGCSRTGTGRGWNRLGAGNWHRLDGFVLGLWHYLKLIILDYLLQGLLCWVLLLHLVEVVGTSSLIIHLWLFVAPRMNHIIESTCLQILISLLRLCFFGIYFMFLDLNWMIIWRCWCRVPIWRVMQVLAGQTMVKAICSAFGEFLTERCGLILGLGWSFVTSARCWCQSIRNIVQWFRVLLLNRNVWSLLRCLLYLLRARGAHAHSLGELDLLFIAVVGQTLIISRLLCLKWKQTRLVQSLCLRI